MKQLISLFLCAAILAPCLSGCRKEAVSEQAQEPSSPKRLWSKQSLSGRFPCVIWPLTGLMQQRLARTGVRFYMHTKRTRLTILKFPRRFFRSGSRRKLGRIAP